MKELILGQGNSSYMCVDKDAYYIFDCGYTTFEKLKDTNPFEIWEKSKRIIVFISHRHPDHICGLADLIFYAYFVKHKTITVVSPDDEILNILYGLGVKKAYFIYMKTEYYTDSNIMVLFKETTHVDTMKSYSLYFNLKHKNHLNFYSGDSNSIDLSKIEGIAKLVFAKKVDRYFIEMCDLDYLMNPHNYYKKFDKHLMEYCKKNKCDSLELKEKIICMHLNSEKLKENLEKLGYRTN